MVVYVVVVVRLGLRVVRWDMGMGGGRKESGMGGEKVGMLWGWGMKEKEVGVEMVGEEGGLWVGEGGVMGEG